MAVIPESHLDLFESAKVVYLGTIGPKGEPQITALWFVWDGAALHMSINTSRQKLKNLVRDPHASAFFADPANDYKTLELRGTVTVIPDPEYTYAAAVNSKYSADVSQMDQPGETRAWVTFNIDKVNAF